MKLILIKNKITSKQNIALIGMAGAGKSMVGKKLAFKLKYIFLDLDDLLEIKYKKNLDQIIKDIGEEKFIDLEEKYLIDLLKHGPQNTVFSPGGSIILSEKAMKELKKRALIIFINTPYSLIKSRTFHEKTRGAVIGMKERGGLRKVYNYRLPLYKKYSDMKISTGHLSEEEVVDKIIKLL